MSVSESHSPAGMYISQSISLTNRFTVILLLSRELTLFEARSQDH
jgi:hypothetical protein